MYKYHVLRNKLLTVFSFNNKKNQIILGSPAADPSTLILLGHQFSEMFFFSNPQKLLQWHNASKTQLNMRCDYAKLDL